MKTFGKILLISILFWIIGFVLTTALGGKPSGNIMPHIITAYLMKALCLSWDGRPLYKRVFLHAIWIAVLKGFLNLCFILYMMRIKFNQLGILGAEELLIMFSGFVVFYYLFAVGNGTLTILWCSEPSPKHETINKKVTIYPKW